MLLSTTTTDHNENFVTNLDLIGINFMVLNLTHKRMLSNGDFWQIDDVFVKTQHFFPFQLFSLIFNQIKIFMLSL